MNLHSFVVRVLFIAIALSGASCVSQEAPTELIAREVAGGSNKEASVKAFSQTVQPIVVKNCASCHGDNGAQSPRFAQTDSEASYDILMSSGKVDFSNVSKSRLVQRLASDKHNCWGSCADAANEMSAAINKWSELAAATTAPIGEYQTKSLPIASAEVRMAKTENGTLLLQAEDGVLEGRFKPYTHSKASNFGYISGSAISPHPYGGTGRTGDVRISCETLTPSDFYDTVNGPFTISERERFLGYGDNEQAKPDAYSQYTMQVSARIIDPTKRADFLQYIKQARQNGQEVILGDLTNQGFFLVNNPEDMNEERIGGPKVLPDFVRHSEFVSDPNINQDKDFFAPRFGPAGTDYFGSDFEGIRVGIDPDQKQQDLYNRLRDKFRDYFYNSNGTPENSIRSIPFGLRRLPDGTAYNRSAAHAELFFNTYFPLSYSESIQSAGDGFQKLDQYLFYYIDPGSRSIADQTQRYYGADGREDSSKREVFDFARGSERLDLTHYFTGKNSADPRTIYKANFSNTLHPILQNSCKGCHGGGGGLPAHSSDNLDTAYNAVAAYIDFDSPANSLPVKKMGEGHNCGASCSQLETSMTNAINQWKSLNANDLQGAASSNSGFESLPIEERTPGRAKYEFEVTEAGAYNVWLKVMTSENLDEFNIRILDKLGRPVPNCRADETCSSVATVYNGKTDAEIDDMGCRNYEPGMMPEWVWWTPGREDVDRRIKWNLGVGTYTLEVVEDSVGAKLDLVAISKNPAFNPAENLIDESYISDIKPKVLKYDLSSILGGQVFFEVEVKDINDESYMFRSPRFVKNGQNIRAKGLKILLNDNYEFSNSTYSELNLVAGQEEERLSISPLVAVKMFGWNSDKVAFAFDALGFTDAQASIIRPDEPQPIEGRVCRRVDVFERTVKPIVSKIRLMRKYRDNDQEGYQSYTQNYPGRRAEEPDEAPLYTCTTCHNEEHIYFKMTSYIGDSQTLCDQALSRVDFNNFRRSLLLRGLNGTFNHPKLHFVQEVPLEGSGENLRFKENSSKVGGLDATWIGERFETYKNGVDFNLNDYSGADRDYLAKFVGQYKVVNFKNYDNPLHPADGAILTSNFQAGTYNPETNTYDDFRNSGTNLVTGARNPVDFLNRKGDFNPSNVGGSGILKVKDECLGSDGRGVRFNESDGLYYDPCNNNIEVSSNFERVKENYREAIIEWMKAEKEAYEAAGGN